MDEFQEELRVIIGNENILFEQLASALEETMGLERGTRANAEEVVVQVEERISQTAFAIDLLDEERYIVPMRALQNLNNYHKRALVIARERLEQVKWNGIE